MTILTESTHAGEFLLSEAEGTRSREVATLASGQNLAAGAILELVSGTFAGGNAVVTGFDGLTSSQAIGVLFDAVDASAGNIAGAVIIARDAEVKTSAISVKNDNTAEDIKAAAITGLAALGVIAR